MVHVTLIISSSEMLQSGDQTDLESKILISVSVSLVHNLGLSFGLDTERLEARIAVSTLLRRPEGRSKAISMPEVGLRSGLISLVAVSSPSREFGCGVEGKLVSFNITVRKMRADVRAGKSRTGKCATGRSRTGKCRTGNLPVYEMLESVIPEI